MKQKLLLVMLIAALLSLSASLFCQEYLQLTQAVNVEATEDQPTRAFIGKMYISPKGVRIDYGDELYLLFIEAQSKFYLIYPAKKEYSNIELEAVKLFIEQNDALLGETTATGSNTGKEEKVIDWDTEVWKFVLASDKSEIDMTACVSTEYMMTPSLEKCLTEMIKYQGRRGALTRETLKAKGIILKMDIAATLEGQLMVLTMMTVDIFDDPLEDAIFEIPQGFTAVPVNQDDFLRIFM